MSELELTQLDNVSLQSDDGTDDDGTTSGSDSDSETAGIGLVVINKESAGEDEDSDDTIDMFVWLALHNGDLEEVKKWIDSLPKKQRQQIINNSTINGDKALHIACLNNQLEIAKMLLKARADPNVLNLSKCTALHCACSNDDEENIDELVKTLLASKCKFDTRDEDGYTPLHYAAENGHTTTVDLLLKRGAKLKVLDGDGNTPVHMAAAGGHEGTLAVMIAHMPECVHWEGEFSNTPLHVAADYGNIMAAKKLLNSGANPKATNNAHETPLHQCVSTPDPRLAQILLDAGADPNAKDQTSRTPIYLACLFGNTDVVALLMQRGAKVDAKCLEEAVTEGYERMAFELLKCDNWPELMRHTITVGKTKSTPFREMIKKMPDVAEEILNRCTVVDPEVSDQGDFNYEAVFNYEFIEDFRDSENDFDEGVDFPGRRSKKQSEEKKTYGVSYTEVTMRQRKNFSTTWGPVGFKKANHPLAIMVETGRLKLLTHPVVRSLLHYKWNKFGQIGYFLNLFTYCVFLTFLTVFALVVPNPQTAKCIQITGGETNDTSDITSATTESEITCDNSFTIEIVIYVCAGIVIFSALCRLLLELAQLIVQRFNYIVDLVNWMEIVLFTCSIIFVWIFHTPCQCPFNWQWQVGAVAIFLAWLSLIIFFAKFPLTGIYILMFGKIIYTFLKMVTLSVLLVIAFALTFYMAFYEPSITRSPFSHPGRSILKIMTMTTGEFDFDSIFRQDPTGDGDTLAEIPFPPISYILWIIFIVVMPILLTNMLVGLAVGDIKAIQDEAVVRKLALQVKQVLTTEELLPRGLRRRFVTGYKRIFPNRSVNVFGRFRFWIWGGERYDSHDSLKRALQNKTLSKPDQIEETLVARGNNSKEGGHGGKPRFKDTVKKTMGALRLPTSTKHTDSEMSTVLEELNEMKRTMNKMELLIQQLAKKQGITVAATLASP